jgi:translation initiation factor eIF-2B subunit delta
MGASAVFSNGAVMSRVGTSVVATVAYHYKKPVIILSETFKFSEAVRLDSFVWNEIGNPEELVDTRILPPSEKLPSFLVQGNPGRKGPLKDWRTINPLKLLNIHYDVTPSKFITMIACDLGQIPPTSCLSVLRECGGILGVGENFSHAES